MAVNKTFVVVRHPLDSLISHACMLNSGSHSVKPEYSFDKDYPEWWDSSVRKFAKKMAYCFERTIRDAKQHN